MTDLPSSLGIEAVELVSEGSRVTVRVTGRWRRRRPELRGQAMLVLETEAGRQRFLAMPEPPSLTGAAPGTWRMSFSVPAALAPQLPGRTFLQLGGVMVPLPIGEISIAAKGAEPADPDLLEARRARSSELAAESARRRAAELATRVSGLEHDLEDAHAESERLRGVIAERERGLRTAEQHAHAERALRSELEQDLARLQARARHDLAALHERVAELERELIRTRRAVDEAGHLAAAAEAGRAGAERRLIEAGRRLAEAEGRLAEAEGRLAEAERGLAQPAAIPQAPRPAAEPAPIANRAQAEVTRHELDLHRASGAKLRPPPLARPLASVGDRALLGLEADLVGQRRERRAAELEPELIAAREELEAQRRRSARAYEAIEHVRAELRQLREAGLATPPPAIASPPAEAGPPPAVPQSAAPVQAEQLSAALARLRERARAEPADEPAPAPEPAPEPSATRPWMSEVFRSLAAQDATTAGRLLVALLPAQRIADPQAVAYDLVLGDVLCAHVTVTSTAAHIETDDTVRPLSEVDFQVVGDLAGVARLLVAGPMRRRLRWLAPRRRPARVRGDRSRLVALDRLIGATLSAGELHGAGVRLDPGLTMTVAGLMIEPGWTAAERFAIGHREPDAAAPGAYLQVRSGKPPLPSTEAPHGPVETTVVCPAGDLLGVLAGGGAGAEVVGERRPLTLLAQWLERAQCG